MIEKVTSIPLRVPASTLLAGTLEVHGVRVSVPFAYLTADQASAVMTALLTAWRPNPDAIDWWGVSC